MENTEKKQGEPAMVAQPEPNHTAIIKSQVLAKIGKLPRLDRVQISKHHNGKYRVNIWETTEPKKNIAVTPSPRIALSYYLTVSDTGEIVHSSPAMTKLGSPA